jgi:hypothetical protein
MAFDPGRTIGVAHWYPEQGEWDAWQTKDPFEALEWVRRKIFNYPMSPFSLTVEKYAGGGYKTNDGIYTTELVGFFKYYFEFYFATKVRLPLSQQRLSGLETATKWAKSMDIEGPHSWDALAHTIVDAREYE